MKTHCHVVAKERHGDGSIGEEVRLYSDDDERKLVKTLHLTGKDCGQYVEGQTYDVEPDEPAAQAADIDESDLDEPRQPATGTRGAGTRSTITR